VKPLQGFTLPTVTKREVGGQLSTTDVAL